MSDNRKCEFVWGAEAIGSVIGKNRRETLWLLQNGMIPARKDGKRWVASRAALLEHMQTPNNGYQPDHPMVA